jgi:hypothetical protein
LFQFDPMKTFNFVTELQCQKLVDVVILSRMDTRNDAERPWECDGSTSLHIRLQIERGHLIHHIDRQDISKRYVAAWKDLYIRKLSSNLRFCSKQPFIAVL